MVKVVVCGGSIGGLSTALSLNRCGCEVVVYERASAIQPAGAVRISRPGYLCTILQLVEFRHAQMGLI